MGSRVLIGGIALLACSTTFAEVISFNSSKARTVFDGGRELDYLTAWSYTGGSAAENKAYSYKSWISFSTSSLPRPYASSAELTLTQSYNAITLSNPVTLNLYALTDSAGDSWGLGTINWTNAPGNVTNSSKAVDPAKTTLVGSYTFTGQFPATNEVVHIPFSAAGISFLNSDANGTSTFILAANDDSTQYTSFFAYTTSTLLVAVPEPTVIGGIFATSLGLLIRRRAKK